MTRVMTDLRPSTSPDTGFVVGLDLSLTCSGVSAVDLGTGTTFMDVVRSSKRAASGRNDTAAQTMDRLVEITEKIVAKVRAADPVLVVMESATFSTTKDTSAHRRAGLWWRVYEKVGEHYPVLDVTPSQIKKFVTGKGNAPKTGVAAMVLRYADLDVTNSSLADTADATGAAWLGSAALGGSHPLGEAKVRRAVADALELPPLRVRAIP